MAKYDPDRPIPSAARLDDVVRLTSDLGSIDSDQLDLLRALLESVPDDESSTSEMVFGGSLSARLSAIEPDDALRERAASVQEREIDIGERPLHVLPRDSRDEFLTARLAGPLTALAGAERIGPFELEDGFIFFDFWRPAQRFEVTETGSSSPAFVLSSARRPTFSSPGPVTIDLQAGTAWIRGDLIDSTLPSGAYVGVTVTDGKLRLANATQIADDSASITSPVEAELELQIVGDSVTPAEGGCGAGASITLPTLTLGFGPAGFTVNGTPGSASLWSQSFDFQSPTGSVQFNSDLWTLLLSWDVAQDTFDGSAINARLADFDGDAVITEGALGLPVVVANPAVLGAAAIGPSWWLRVSDLTSRWYEPDPRFHILDPWIQISDGSVSILDRAASPLSPPVGTDYRLWELAGTDGEQIPWAHNYTANFLFFHRCHAADGETLLTTGKASVRLDRPLDANGRIVKTHITDGIMQQRTDGDGVAVTLGGFTTEGSDNLLVLRNALVWSTRAIVALAQGRLVDRQDVDRGRLFVYFGVYGWSPTLPDPYVGNFDACVPNHRRPRSLLVAAVRWNNPSSVSTAFLGNIGRPIVCDRKRSPGKPVPAPRSDGNPGVGRTQEDQSRVYPSEQELGAILQARKTEAGERKRRAANAEKTNAASLDAIDRQLLERLGRTPSVFLLDVSTNQDLLGVALWAAPRDSTGTTVSIPETFGVRGVDVIAPLETQRLVTLPQVQWEPVRTLDVDQDILTLGWFPTPLASPNDGGATVLGARSQKLSPVIPSNVLDAASSVFEGGTNVVFRTTLPFGIVTVVDVNPNDVPGNRKADTLEVTRPSFLQSESRGGMQITARAEGGRSESAISPYFAGATRQLINGVDLASGSPLGLSVLSSTGDPMGDVETIFNNDMAANPKVPVTRFDLSGYGGSNFSKWENPFALFAETAKTQFEITVGRCALEIIKVASVLHPWGINLTRSVIVERRSGGGVIRRDTGWQATSPGVFDYRYVDTTPGPPQPKVADYAFDAGIFQGLRNVRAIRPAPGEVFSDGAATFVPYYFDADLALDGLAGTTPAPGILGWLQTEPNGDPADKSALQALIEAQGPVGGPIDAWIDFGPSQLPFRARRIEVDVTDNGGVPLFVATVRGVPRLPKTGSWSVVRRPVSAVPAGSGEAVPVSETNGVPLIRRAEVAYDPTDDRRYDSPRIVSGGASADWRMADPDDLLSPSSPENDYCLLQSAPTHAFLFPRPVARLTRIESTQVPELADIIARSTSKGAFPPPENVIALASPLYFNVGSDGGLSLPSRVTIVNHPTPLRIAGEVGHGSALLYDDSTLEFELENDSWGVEFSGLKLWSDIAGLERASGARMRIVGGTGLRPQVVELDALVQETVEEILTYLPVFGARGPLGPIDLGASNAKHEIKLEIGIEEKVPKGGFPIGGGAEIKLKLGAKGSVGFDVESGGVKQSGTLSAGLEGEFPILSAAVAKVYILVQLDVNFSITSVSSVITSEKLELIAFVGVGVKGSIAGFEAYAYLGIGFVFVYDFTSGTPKYGGLVRLEAGVTIVTSFTICKVKLVAELKGLIYKKSEPATPPATGMVEKTACDYTGKIKLQVDIFLIISINVTYTISDTKLLE